MNFMEDNPTVAGRPPEPVSEPAKPKEKTGNYNGFAGPGDMEEYCDGLQETG